MEKELETIIQLNKGMRLLKESSKKKMAPEEVAILIFSDQSVPDSAPCLVIIAF